MKKKRAGRHGGDASVSGQQRALMMMRKYVVSTRVYLYISTLCRF